MTTKEIVKKDSEGDLNVLVDLAKMERAKKAVYGGAKGDTNEVKLAGQLRGKFEGDALVVEVYRGLGGLVDLAKAKQNRENEKKAAKKRAAR